MFKKKIAIGTANFCNHYGAFSNKRINENEIKKVLKICKKFEIDTFDTSPDYGNSEKILGNLAGDNLKIITKIPKFEEIGNNANTFFEDLFYKSTENLKTKKIYAVLFRNPTSLLKNISLWNLAERYKRNGKIKKIGITIYDPKELSIIYNLLKPDIVQTPYNFFDRRIETSGWIEKLFKDDVEIHCRSIFLQGLLLKKSLPEELSENKDIWKKYQLWLKANNLSALEVCLNFFSNKKEISKIIVGIDSADNLNKIFLTKKKKFEIPKWLNKVNEKITDPRKW